MIEKSLFWTLVVAIAFPAATLVLGEIVLKLRRLGDKRAEPLECVRVLVLPALVLFTVLFQVIGLARDTILVRMAETLMWLAILYTVLAFSNRFFFESAREGTWQARVPKIFLDTSRFVLISIGAAILISNVWGADLGGLLTALGVGSLVLGLALQDSLGNIFSGAALLFERPFQLGEWIQVGDTVGKVKEITWRSVHLVTRSGDLVVVPNSELAKGSIYNFNRPDPLHELSLELSFSFDDPPNKVKKTMIDTALATEGVLSRPGPRVFTSGYGDCRITYAILLCIRDYGEEPVVRERFLTRIWYVMKRNELSMPYPITSETEYRPATLTPAQQVEIARKALIAVGASGQFQDETLEMLARRGRWLEYASEEIVVSQGEELAGMYLILSGTAKLSVLDRAGRSHTPAEVSEGEFFGERASLLTERHSDVTVTAIEDLTALVLDPTTVRTMLEHSPRLADRLGEIMELRRRAIGALKI